MMGWGLRTKLRSERILAQNESSLFLTRCPPEWEHFRTASICATSWTHYRPSCITHTNCTLAKLGARRDPWYVIYCCHAKNNVTITHFSASCTFHYWYLDSSNYMVLWLLHFNLFAAHKDIYWIVYYRPSGLHTLYVCTHTDCPITTTWLLQIKLPK